MQRSTTALRRATLGGGPFLRFLICALAIPAFGCSPGSSLTPPRIERFPYELDESPAWSPDGRWIVFHRTLGSSLGPPGLYRVDRQSGQVTLVLSGDVFWPTQLRFAPDSRRVACIVEGALYVVDIFYGSLTEPPVGSSPKLSPDWSGDGTRLLYRRLTDPTSGFWIFDYRDSSDLPLVNAAGLGLGGEQPRWGPGDSTVVYTVEGAVELFHPDSRRVETLAPATAGAFYLWARWIPGTDTVLVENTWSASFTYEIDLASRRLRAWGASIGAADAFSPTSDSVVVERADPVDSTGRRYVLFVESMADRGGKPGRQLTFYVPLTN